jgi:cathepsin X
MRLLLITILLFLGYLTEAEKHSCYVSSKIQVDEKIIKPLESIELPEQHSWDNFNGKNYLTLIRNDHAPVFCGGCWAQAVASSISDRIKIINNASSSDVNISPQIFLS